MTSTDISQTSSRSTDSPADRNRWPGYGLVLLVIVLSTGTFLLAPWSFEAKARAALHGLCAQRPSHSFLLGDQTLPFDARMTGIYGGFLVTTLFLAIKHRFRAFRLPPRRVIAVLAGFVLVMALDGTNSLLLDLQLDHPYHPRNDLRLVTGLLTGIALATLICFLVSSTLWYRGRYDTAPIQNLREVGLVLLLQIPFAAAAMSGASMLYVPMVSFLLASAVLVVAAMMLVVIVLIRGQEGSFEGVAGLQRPTLVAVVLAFVAMAAFSGGRHLLEQATGAPPLS